MALTKKQQEVVDHSNGDLLVSASAGSGKTHTMITRIIRLICEEGVSVNQILAVTFTETSATDMKEKLQDALVKKINAVSEMNLKKRLCAELEEVATADISTMHSFCARIIRKYFFEVGLSPDFKIADKADVDAMSVSAIDKTFREFYQREDKWFKILIDRHSGRKDDELKNLVLGVYKFCISEADPEAFMDLYEKYYNVDFYKQALASIYAEFSKLIDTYKENALTCREACRQVGYVNGYNWCDEFYTELDRAKSMDAYALKTFIAEYKRTAYWSKMPEELEDIKNLASKTINEFKAEARSIANSVKGNFDEDCARLEECKEHTLHFVNLLKRFKQVFDSEKREENVLDFNDLEHFALKILQNERVRSAVKEKYKYIFVDEYQDTNGVQEEIINAIANKNVFMVGDVKQSIYGFRGCRADFFINKEKVMGVDEQSVKRLNDNFRSSNAVIEMVNAIFNFCMTEEHYGEKYKRSELKAGGLYKDGEDEQKYYGRAQIHFLDTTEEKIAKYVAPNIYNVFETVAKTKISNAEATAGLIVKIIGEEMGKEFYDIKSKRLRRVNYGDIAVIMRGKNTKSVVELVNTLVAMGLPVTAEVGSNVLDFAEIKMLISVLKLTQSFCSDVDLVGVLKSPVGNFTDEDLLTIAHFYHDSEDFCYESGFKQAFDYFCQNNTSELADKARKFKEYFDRLRFLADFVGAQGVLNNVIRDKNIESYFYAGKNGKKSIARLNKFIDCTVVNGKTLTVSEFLDRTEKSSEAFMLSNTSSENTVKVLTIHASKGLEYPVVIVSGLEHPFNTKDDSKEILQSRDYGLFVKSYDNVKRVKEENILREFVKLQFKKERLREEMRLFYVATTRAKYSLHLIVSDTKYKAQYNFAGAKCYAEMLPKTLPYTTYYKKDINVESLTKGTRAVISGVADQKVLSQMQKDFAFNYAFNEETLLPLKCTVTGAVKDTVEEDYPVITVFDEETTDIEKGNIAHKVMEYFDFSSETDIYTQVNKMVENGVLTSEDAGKINLERIKRVVENGALNGVKSCKLYREQAFIVNVEADRVTKKQTKENIVLQGIVDLLAIGEEGAFVIDYKYSSLEKSSLKARYEKQLDLYAYAVEKVLNKKVLNKILINLFTGDAVIC